MKKLDKLSILFFAVVTVCCFGAVDIARGQAFPDLLFPPLEAPQNEESLEDESVDLFPAIDALSMGDEEETLAKYSKSSPAFEKMFEPVLSSGRQSLVTVRSTGSSKSRRAKKRQIALGTLVSEKGWVLTKASELKGKLYCEMASGELIAAEIYGLAPEYDLALLQLKPNDERVEGGWAVGKWADGSAETGDWLATPLDHKQDQQVGVVSVDSRPIPPSKPFIGIFMRDAKPTGAKVVGVQKKSPASSAGLKKSDVILRLDEHLIKDSADIRKRLEQYDAGDLVTLTVVRNDKQKSVKLTLANRDKVSSENMRSNQQNSMGTRLSGRRKDFPLAFQHDTTLQAKECGGPLVNLDGEIVGINIARAGRVATLAIPTEKVMEVVGKLGTGNFTPEAVNASKITKVNQEIGQTQEFATQLSEKIKQLKAESSARELAVPGYQAAVDDMVRKLKLLKEEIDQQKGQLEESKREVTRMRKLVKDLERERERLKTGVR